MCDVCDKKLDHWKGWIALPPQAGAPRGAGAWVDLSHAIGPRTPTMPMFPPPQLDRVLSLPDDPANITRLQMIVHQGTHLDAPFHIFSDGPAMNDIPAERFTGAGVVLRMVKQPFGLIEVADFEQAAAAIAPGDIVLLDTGWARHAGTPLYEQHPSLSVEAADFLVQRKVKLIGVDFATPDLSTHRRPADFTWPVHHVLLSQGVLVGEHLTNLSALADQRAEIMFCPLNIEGADGAPARVLARGVPS